MRVEDAVSDSKTLTCGVPQGSHLAPLLFLLFINTLPDSLSHYSDVYGMYADDVVLLHPHDKTLSHATNHQRVQSDLNSCQRWARTMRGEFSAEKTKVLSTVPHDLQTPFTIDSVPVSYVNSITHLGIHINLCLNFDEHFCSITKKFRSRVNLLRHMSSTLPASAATLLYKAYVRPVVEYATPVWALWLKQSQLQSLEILQASAIRCFLRKLHISFDFDSPKAKLNELCGLESLQYRRQIFFLTTLHKIIHKHPEFLRLSNLSISTSARRPNKVVFHSNGTHTSRSFLFVVSTLWNCLVGWLVILLLHHETNGQFCPIL